MEEELGKDWLVVEGRFKEINEEMGLYSGVLLPWSCVDGGSCNGLERSGGLWLRCGGLSEGSLCKKCEKSCREKEGEPLYGLWSDRIKKGWKPKKGKVKTWGVYLKEKNMTKDDGLKILKMHQIPENKVPESEWITSVESKKRSGMGITARFIPKKGKSRSVSRKSGNYFKHVGFEAGCQVHFNKESGKVRKVSGEKWPDEAHLKFVEMYGEPDEEGFGVDKPKKKENVTSNDETEFMERIKAERAKMVVELEAEKEKMRLEYEKKLQNATSTPKAPESKTSLPKK